MVDKNSIQYMKLKDISIKKPEYGSGSKASIFDSTLPRYVRITDIDENGNLKNENKVSPELIEEKYFLEENDLLFARSGSVGKTYLYNKNDGLCQFAGYLIRFKINTEIVLPKYVFLFTKSPFYWNWVESKKRTMTISNINAKQYSELEIPIFSLDIQKKIVEKLEIIEKLIAYKTDSIELLDSYLKSVFFEMFGDIISNSKNWNMGLLEDIAIFKTKSMNPIDFDENWYYVGLENIISRKDSFSNLSLVADNEIKSSKYYFNQDVVLYGKLRPYLNKVALPNFEGICSTDIIPILPKENSNKYFIRFLLSHEYYVNLSTQRSTGANLPRVSPTKLKKFEIPIPPIELQNQFAEIVQQVEEIKKCQLKSKKELENLFNNLMQKAFKGKLIC